MSSWKRAYAGELRRREDLEERMLSLHAPRVGAEGGTSLGLLVTLALPIVKLRLKEIARRLSRVPLDSVAARPSLGNTQSSGADRKSVV